MRINARYHGLVAVVGVLALAGLGGPLPAGAETIDSALARAYQNNPQLNAQRAALRAIDETVPQALAGYRPRVSATADAGVAYTRIKTDNIARMGPTTTTKGDTLPRGVGVAATQTLFNGFQTANRTRAAEQQVNQGRESLRLIAQQVLLDAAAAYMNILRDSAIVDLQRRNVEVLDEQLRQTRDRFNVGEVTRTDVAQSESRLAAARSQFLVAQSNHTTSRANYRRIIGVDPGKLTAARPVDRLAPRNLPGAIDLGTAQNPSVTAAMYGVDVAMLQVKINEGALYPVVTLEGNVQQRYDTSLTTPMSFSAAAVTRITIPLYQGGAEYGLIRQSKETLSQSRLVLEQVRDQARATVVQTWGQLEAAKAQITASQAQVSAAEIALNGVREEARVGQRTTLDVLNAQQELVNARVALVTAQRDRVVASYTLLSAVGRLAPEVLALPTEAYDPAVHYHQVRDKWFGVRTPDGR